MDEDWEDERCRRLQHTTINFSPTPETKQKQWEHEVKVWLVSMILFSPAGGCGN